MAFSMVACGNKSASAERTDAKDTNNDGKFVVGFDQDFPPFGYVGDDGEYTGFDSGTGSGVRKAYGTGDRLPADRLGRQGYGTGVGNDRLHLERLYHGWT